MECFYLKKFKFVDGDIEFVSILNWEL